MDLIRLAIVYETQAAAQKLAELDKLLLSLDANTEALNGRTKQLKGVQEQSGRSLGATGKAMVGLAQAMSTGQVSATGLTSKLTQLGGKAGIAGVVIAVVAGALLLLKRHLDANREAAEKFQDQLRTVTRRVDDLFRARPKTGFQEQVEQLSDAILDIDRKLARQRLNLLERWFGGASLKEILGSAKRFFAGGEDPTLRGQRGALGRQRDRVSDPGAELLAARERQSATRGTDTALLLALGASRVERLQSRLSDAQKALEELITLGLDPLSDEALYAAKGIRQLEDSLRQAQRAEQRTTKGLQIMADSLEQFVIEGSASFEEFLNNILRMLYRDFTGELIGGIVRHAFHPTPGSTGAGGSGGIQLGGDTSGSPSGAVVSNTNFNIQTMDAQGVAQWVQRNGATVAAEVARQATRSRGMRKALSRG